MTALAGGWDRLVEAVLDAPDLDEITARAEQAEAFGAVIDLADDELDRLAEAATMGGETNTERHTAGMTTTTSAADITNSEEDEPFELVLTMITAMARSVLEGRDTFEPRGLKALLVSIDSIASAGVDDSVGLNGRYAEDAERGFWTIGFAADFALRAFDEVGGLDDIGEAGTAAFELLSAIRDLARYGEARFTRSANPA